MSEWQMLRRAFVREFLQLYQSLPALWQVSSRDYKDRVAKTRAYDAMVKKLREVLPGATADCVRRRINILRTNFRKEMRKCVEADRQGAIYTPKLWYFGDLLFLRDQGALRDQHEPITADLMPQVRCVDQKVLLGEAAPGYCSPPEQSGPAYSPPLEQPAPDHGLSPERSALGYEPPPEQLAPDYVPPLVDVKQEVVMVEELEPLAGEPSPSPRSQDELDDDLGDDEEGTLARHVAAKLRRLDPLQRIFAEKLIHDVLFEAQLGSLTRTARVVVHPEH